VALSVEREVGRANERDACSQHSMQTNRERPDKGRELKVQNTCTSVDGTFVKHLTSTFSMVIENDDKTRLELFYGNTVEFCLVIF